MPAPKTAASAWEKFYFSQPLPWAGAVELPQIPEEGYILELGCAGGRMLLGLAKAAPGRVVGLDWARFGLLGLFSKTGGWLVQADISELPFCNNSFSLVICRHVLGHLEAEGRARAAGQIVRVLSPGGTCVAEEFSVSDVRCGKGTLVEDDTYVRGNGISTHYFRPGELGGLFVSCKTVARECQRDWSERAGRAKMTRAVVTARISK